MTYIKPVILVVDDLPDNINVISNVLNKDYRIRVALNGKKAIEIALNPKTRPDLILLDIMMPDMDGYEVCSQLKSNQVTKDIPVIFVTASHSAVDEVKALTQGGVDFISKPIIPQLVIARVKTHLKLRNQELHLRELVEEKTREIRQSKEQILETLGRAASYKDNDTSNHVFRMSRYAEVVALKVSGSKDWSRLLRQSATMHDIGKIGIPDRILLKPGKLDAEEWTFMQKHVHFGGEIIDDETTPILKMSKDVALYHHEKWDGSGYLKGLKGEEIPIVARIVAVVDVFDALTSGRPYKKPWSVEDAVSLINEQAGQHFDPEIVAHFNDVIDDILEIKAQFEKEQ